MRVLHLLASGGVDILPLISLAEQLFLIRTRVGFMKETRKRNTLRT